MKMIRKIPVFLAILCFCASVVHAEVAKVPLYKLAPVTSVDLRCIQGEYAISIPIPKRWKIRKAVLNIKYVNSSNLLRDKSQLVVKMNGSTIGQVKLDPRAPDGNVAITIPKALLQAGYNSLGFMSALHYTDECEQFCAPNLWTTLNFLGSSLAVTYDLKPVPLKLSEVSDFLFDPKILPHGRVNVIMEAISSDAITNAGIVASGIAARFNYRNVFFSVSNDIRPNTDNILIGRKTFIERYLKQRGIDVQVAGPFLKIMHLPSRDDDAASSRHALLLVSGLDSQEIKLAAKTLAHMTLPYPGSEELIAKDLKLPEISLYSGKNVLTTDTVYSFKELGFNTQTFSGFNPNASQLSFRLPADFLIKPNKYAKIKLNLTYGAGMRNDSVMNVLVNEKIVGVIHLKNPSGESYEDYKIELPTYLFKPGYNAIRFAPVLNPVAHECDILRPEGFFLTLFENSTFYYPAMPHFVEMPDLELFMTDGFPFTRKPDGSESMIYLTRLDHQLAASALNIIGMLSQKNGYPLIGTPISFEQPKNWNGELIVLGDVKTIPERYWNLAPLKLSQPNVVPYPVIGDWENDSSFALSTQTGSIGPDLGVVMEFQSPDKKGRSILLMTGNSTKEVLSLSRLFLEPGVQGQFKGDLLLIDLKDPDARMRALSAGEKYYSGTFGPLFLIEYYFHKYMFLYYVALFVLITLISLALYLILKRIREKRMHQGR
jgi:hypothetical protein